MRRLWRITERLNTLHEANWTAETRAVVDEFAACVVAAVTGEGYSGSDEHERQWSFPGALLYSITVITTIGERHSRNLKPRNTRHR